jgi:UDP-N-acetylglucosamine:LPS N-acetylglucosamine transferase
MPSSSIVMPELYKVRQHFDRAQVKDLDSGIAAAVSQAVGGCTLPIGATIAVTAGSRGIRSIDRMLQLIVRKLRDIGYEPFLVAAMGSHGSGEEAGSFLLTMKVRCSFQSISHNKERNDTNVRFSDQPFEAA